VEETRVLRKAFDDPQPEEEGNDTKTPEENSQVQSREKIPKHSLRDLGNRETDGPFCWIQKGLFWQIFCKKNPDIFFLSAAARAKMATFVREWNMHHRRNTPKAAGLLTAACICSLCICSCARQSTQPYTDASLQRYAAARKYYSEQRLEPALSLLLENHEQAPGFTANSFLIGKIYYFKNEHGQAEAYWRHTLETNTYHLDTRKWLARLFLEQERLQEAEAVLLDALSVSSEDPELLILLAKAKRRQGDLAGAIELYQKSQAFGERLSEASIDLAEIYYGFGLPERARQELERALGVLGESSALSPSLAAVLDQFEQNKEEGVAP
jgi:tetratricopeptide (TPR) repeat protein